MYVYMYMQYSLPEYIQTYICMYTSIHLYVHVCAAQTLLFFSDSADKVVQRTGKFEELVVASHDIAASTAQLVAASRVKARPKSEKLKGLKSSSRDGGCVVYMCLFVLV